MRHSFYMQSDGSVGECPKGLGRGQALWTAVRTQTGIWGTVSGIFRVPKGAGGGGTPLLSDKRAQVPDPGGGSDPDPGQGRTVPGAGSL